MWNVILPNVIPPSVMAPSVFFLSPSVCLSLSFSLPAPQSSHSQPFGFIICSSLSLSLSLSPSLSLSLSLYQISKSTCQFKSTSSIKSSTPIYFTGCFEPSESEYAPESESDYIIKTTKMNTSVFLLVLVTILHNFLLRH
jgi:hypothetical protein